MSNPYEYHVAQEINAQTKLWSVISIYVKDLIIFVALLGVFTAFRGLVADQFTILYYGGCFILAVILIVPSSMNPKRRMYESIFLFLRRDKELYYPIFMKERTHMIKEKKNIKLVEDIVSIIGYDHQYQCFIMKNGYMNIMEIITKDIVNASDDEIEYDIVKLTKFNKLTYESYKIISMNFPCKTQDQQSYLKYKIDKTKNATFKPFLENGLKELEWVQENKSKREFYLMYFAESQDDLRKMELDLKSTLNSTERMLGNLTQKKKELIIYRLYNPASVLTGGKS